VRLLIVALAVAALVASANAAQVRKLRGWQITHVTMTTTMNDQMADPLDAVCGPDGEARVISATTENRLDARPTRVHWWAIYYPNVRRILPYGDPGTVKKATVKTTLTWGWPIYLDTGGCTMRTKTCTRKGSRPEILLWTADPYPVSRGLVWVWWRRWYQAMWDSILCIPPGVPKDHLLEELPRETGNANFHYQRREYRDAKYDPVTKTRYSTWFRARSFHVRAVGSGALKPLRGSLPVKGPYSYRLDITLRQVFN
jgi:hypothetical protein